MLDRENYLFDPTIAMGWQETCHVKEYLNPSLDMSTPSPYLSDFHNVIVDR